MTREKALLCARGLILSIIELLGQVTGESTRLLFIATALISSKIL